MSIPFCCFSTQFHGIITSSCIDHVHSTTLPSLSLSYILLLLIALFLSLSLSSPSLSLTSLSASLFVSLSPLRRLSSLSFLSPLSHLIPFLYTCLPLFFIFPHSLPSSLLLSANLAKFVLINNDEFRIFYHLDPSRNPWRRDIGYSKQIRYSAQHCIFQRSGTSSLSLLPILHQVALFIFEGR